MQQIIVVALAGLLGTVGVRADETADRKEPVDERETIDSDKVVEREKKQDVILRALLDELERNQGKLKLEDLERPYYIEYTIYDNTQAYVAASLGAVIGKNDRRSRRLVSQVRVGAHELDNTNFRGGGYYQAGGGEAPVPLEDDYNAIRQAIWWASDRNYKDVVETFAQKKAFMKTKIIEDKPDDFSRESPVVHFDDKVVVPADLSQMERVASRVSQVFRNHPVVQKSRVWVQAQGGNRYYVNSERTRLRTEDRVYFVYVTATVQADDGMKLSDSFTVYARKLDDLPSVQELAERCGELVKRLVAVRDAPKLDAYAGPVLFDAEAAAILFARRFAGNFAGGQRPVGSRTSPDDFSKKIGRRVLPRFMNVVDDPTHPTIDGELVLGHYTYDDQGVKAKGGSLVEAGQLKTLLMSRNPSREFSRSTGHGRNGQASVGCLIVSVTDPADAETLKQELIEACQDEDLEFGIRIAALGKGGASAPLAVYKVYADGKEELVRGTEVGPIDLKAFKRMLAGGDKPYVYNTRNVGGQTVVAPAMLFEELDLAKIDRDFDKPPILPSPLAREPSSAPTEHRKIPKVGDS